MREDRGAYAVKVDSDGPGAGGQREVLHPQIKAAHTRSCAHKRSAGSGVTQDRNVAASADNLDPVRDRQPGSELVGGFREVNGASTRIQRRLNSRRIVRHPIPNGPVVLVGYLISESGEQRPPPVEHVEYGDALRVYHGSAQEQQREQRPDGGKWLDELAHLVRLDVADGNAGRGDAVDGDLRPEVEID